MSVLTITARFLQPYSHGRGEDGRPEWPPSPLRLFQALMASGLRNANEGRHSSVGEALRWLERQPAPDIHAAMSRNLAVGYRIYVPDNVGDLVANAWVAGRAGDVADYRTEKDVTAIRLSPEQPAVQYVYRVGSDVTAHLSTLQCLARRLTHLGWGTDQVVGDACVGPAETGCERWMPRSRGEIKLRCAAPGSFEALQAKHREFVGRLAGGVFRPVPPLRAYSVVAYARADAAPGRDFGAFRLTHPQTGRGLSFDPARRAPDVAAWLRHAVHELSRDWPFGSVETTVHGHAPAQIGASSAPRRRFSYVPLPSVTPNGTGGIARALVTPTEGLAHELEWLRRRLGGAVLDWHGAPQAQLEPLEDSDWVLRQYVGSSEEWSTVTPVILPGFSDGSVAKAEGLLRRAFLQAGFEREVIEGIRELEWRNVGFRRGLDLARHYVRPDKVTGPRFHVRVRFGSAITGPLVVGSGRHRGLGIFAIAD